MVKPPIALKAPVVQCTLRSWLEYYGIVRHQTLAALIGGSSALPRHLQTHFGATRAFDTS